MWRRVTQRKIRWAPLRFPLRFPLRPSAVNQNYYPGRPARREHLPAPEERHVHSKPPPLNIGSPGGVKPDNFRFWSCFTRFPEFFRVFKNRRVTQRKILCVTLRLPLRNSAVKQNQVVNLSTPGLKRFLLRRNDILTTCHSQKKGLILV